jgi:hypothetical protein
MSHKSRIIKSLWGITIGDKLRTSYGAGGVVTFIGTPHYMDQFPGDLIIRTWPVLSLGIDDKGIINDVRREGDRYFTDANDEVMIERCADGFAGQMFQIGFDISADEGMAPSYHFYPDVDYTKNAWKCPQCGDFNSGPEKMIGGRGYRWNCPYCEKYGVLRLTVLHPRVIGKKQANSYLVYLNGQDPEPEVDKGNEAENG